ncbi:MAG TPA: HAMP domain-containing sensor histidine kinase, partial [Bacteroidales bacterium]|nr:HAMP domain-containing sensor histidine kinase [Bacteroidales bacterium]
TATPDSEINVSITHQTVSGNADTARITTYNRSYTINKDTSIVSDSSSLIVAAPDETGKMNIIKRGDNIGPNSNAVYMKQQDFLNWVRKRRDEFRNMTDRMIVEMYNWERSLELNDSQVETALSRSLRYQGITTPYEYAIIKGGKVEQGKYKKASKNEFLRTTYWVRLFPDNIIRQDLVLAVIFPERTNYVLGSIGWLLGGSLIFSLFILLTFALSLYFIISQKKISEMKSDFINNMTHEFKTPIATISLAADTINNPKVIGDETRIRHFIDMIKKENSRMNKKVETILQIASLDKKEIEFRFECVSVHDIIQHALETIEIQVQQRNGEIILHLDAEHPEIFGDFDHLTNLVNNLLDNAIKYSPETLEITVSTENKEKGVILSVEDKGIGMSKAVQSKIFERFYRQSSGNIHDVKGFGLGLNYSRAIVEAHKGNITVTSEPGKGSRFDIYLPFNLEN